jgi:hypothetical protein
MNGYGQCPRCGAWTLEHLKSHSHCWECNFVPESARKRAPRDFKRDKASETSLTQAELMYRSYTLVRGSL